MKFKMTLLCFLVGLAPIIRMQTSARAAEPAAELLQLLDVEPRQLESWSDAASLSTEEETQLARMLFRWSTLTPADLDEFVITDIAPNELAEEPAAFRGQLIELRGTAVRAERWRVPEALADVLDLGELYEVRLELNNSSHVAAVFTRAIPPAWPTDEPIRQPASFVGLFLKTGSEGTATFAAKRVAWHPVTVQPKLGVTAGHALLGRYGMDVGLIDDARRHDKRPLLAEDAECFYQMLAASARMDAGTMRARSSPLELGALIASAPVSDGAVARSKLAVGGGQHGRLFSAPVVARRILKVHIESADLREQLGIDHYFQIDAFLPLDDQVVHLQKSPDDVSAPVFANSFPLTLCVAQLPEEMKEGERLSERIIAVGFYFRLWSYDSQFLEDYGGDRQQLSPLLIGHALPSTTDNGLARTSPLWWIAGILLLALLGALWYTFLRWQVRDAEHARQLKRRFTPPNVSIEPSDDAEPT